MVIFDHKGRYVDSWGPDFMGGAHGLYIHKEGREEFLYLCDTKRAVVAKTTLKGEWSGRSATPSNPSRINPARTARRSNTAPPIWPLRPTATFTSA